MTALDQFDRLETLGIWRDHADDPGREVVIKFGKSTLVIEERANVPLTHWSMAALNISHRDVEATTFKSDMNAPESLTIEDPLMLEALDRVLEAHSTPGRHKSVRRPGIWLILPFILGLLGLILVLPASLGRVVYALISPEQAIRVATQMLPKIEERTGPICAGELGVKALNSLAAHMSGTLPVRISVIDMGDKAMLSLPGRHVVLNRRVVENVKSDQELAGWVALGLSERQPGAAMRGLFEDGGNWATLTFLANGQVSEAAQERAVNHMLLSPAVLPDIDETRATEVLSAAKVPASPIVAALRREGLAIVVKGYLGDTEPILTDQEWVALQQICD